MKTKPIGLYFSQQEHRAFGGGSWLTTLFAGKRLQAGGLGKVLKEIEKEKRRFGIQARMGLSAGPGWCLYGLPTELSVLAELFFALRSFLLKMCSQRSNYSTSNTYAIYDVICCLNKVSSRVGGTKTFAVRQEKERSTFINIQWDRQIKIWTCNLGSENGWRRSTSEARRLRQDNPAYASLSFFEPLLRAFGHCIVNSILLYFLVRLIGSLYAMQ
jgi:hypothetical protein